MSWQSGECGSRGPALRLWAVIGSLLLVTACAVTDTTPPTATLASSSDTVTSATTITLEAAASDDTAVTRVVFEQRHTPALLSPQQTWTQIGVVTASPYRWEVPVTSADNGTLDFRASAYDAAGNSTTSATVSVTVTIPGGPGNQPPRFLTEAITGASVGVPYSYAITTTDPDAGDTLTITAPTLPTQPAWLILTDNGDGSATLAGTPGNAEVGDHPVELQVSDNHGADASQAFTVTVSASNRPPEFTSAAPTSATEDSPYQYDIVATDPDAGDTLTITAPVKPAWLTLTDHGGGSATLAGTPGDDDVGDHQLELRVTDSFSATATQTFQLTVTNTNDPPVARDDSVLTDEDVPLLGNVLADNGNGADSDPDLAHGDSLSVALVAGVAHGNLTLNGDGSFSYLPAGNYSGPDSFSYLLSDLAGQSDTATVSITVNPVNDPPSFTGSLADETLIRNTITPNGVGVGIGVTDPEGDPLTVTATSSDQAVVADAVLNPSCVAGNCSLVFVPAADATASAVITLTVSDGTDADSTSFTVHLVPRLVVNTLNGGFGSLRDAINIVSVSGDVIGFDTDGVFATPQTINLLGQLVIDKSLTIESATSIDVTLDGGAAVRLAEIKGNVIVKVIGVRFSNGNAPNTCGSVGAVPCGGGVFVNSGSTLLLEYCQVTGNLAGTGGGAFVDGGSLRLLHSEVNGNSAVDTGGGIANDDGTVVIESSMVYGNHATSLTTGSGGGIANINNAATALLVSLMENNTAGKYGGGIFNLGVAADVEISDTTISSNDAGEAGGGIYNALGDVGLQMSEVASNDAQEGGGIYNTSGTLNVSAQSSVRGNTADFGGGIYSRQLAGGFALPVVTIDNSTVGGSGAADGNQTSDAGAGIFTQDGTLTIRNASSVAGNSGDDGGGIYIDSGTVTIEDSGVSGNGANFGAGILNNGGTLTLTDSGVSANLATGSGGGIYNASGSLDLYSSTVGGRSLASGNRANGDGGGIYNAGSLGLRDCSAVVYNTADADQNASGQGGGYYTTVAPTIDLSCGPDISHNVPDDHFP